jgi:hypothetical protein
MTFADGHSLPRAVRVASDSPHETKLVEPTLDQPFLRKALGRRIGDRAYDSDPLDQHTPERYRVELIAPHKSVRGGSVWDGDPALVRSNSYKAMLRA